MQSFSDQHPLVLERWHFLAMKLEKSPELLAIPLENIARWRRSNRLGNTWALDAWQTKIEAAQRSSDGLRVLTGFLRCDDEPARQLKSCSPFPGVLTRDERDQFTCAWTH